MKLGPVAHQLCDLGRGASALSSASSQAGGPTHSHAENKPPDTCSRPGPGLDMLGNGGDQWWGSAFSVCGGGAADK